MGSLGKLCKPKLEDDISAKSSRMSGTEEFTLSGYMPP
jgi:hypothetical protein